MKITGNALWLFGCRLAGDLLNLGLFVIISRTLGPVGVGDYAYGYAVASFVFVIGSIGIEEYGLRQYARLEPAKRRSFIAELLGTQAVMVAVAVIGLAVYLILTKPTQATLLVVTTLAYYLVAVALSGTLFIPAMAQQRMVGPAVVDLACRGIAFLSAAVAIRYGHLPISTALLGFTCAGTVQLMLATRSAVRHGGAVHVVISRPAVFKIANVLWSFAAVEVFAQLFAKVGVITLTLRVGAAAAGLFATGLRLIEVALMPILIVGVAAYPRLSQLFVLDITSFRRVASDLTWLMIIVAVGVAWALYFVSPQLLVPVLGSKYAGTEHVVQVMAGVAVVQAIEVMFGRLLLAADLQIARAGAVGFGAALSVVLNVVLVAKLGLNGAIGASVLSYLIIDIIYSSVLRRPLTPTVLSRVLLTLLASLVVGAATAWFVAPRTVGSWFAALAFLLSSATVIALSYRRARATAVAVVPAS